MRLLAHELSHVVQQGNGSQPVARRAPEDDAGLAVPAAPAVSLTNARFSSIPRLQGLASGGDPLSKKDNGDPVLAVQQALLDLGYSLLRYHDDGKYGDETGGAISQFRTDQKDPGTELTGTAMIVLDRVAPPQGVAQEHFFDYDRLFADGRLEFAVAIGYDEGLSHEGNVIAIARLADRPGICSPGQRTAWDREVRSDARHHVSRQRWQTADPQDCRWLHDDHAGRGRFQGVPECDQHE